MVRRAGLIDTQASVVQTPNLGGGANSATIKVYDDLAQAAGALGNLVQPMVDAGTAKRAREAVAKGDYRPAGDMTRQDEIYNKIIDAGFMAQASIDVDRMLGDLENKHLGTLNMEEFGKDLDAARTTYLENIDERYAVPLAQAWDKQALSAQQRLSGLATTKAIRTADEAMTARMDLDLDRISDASDLADNDVSFSLMRIESIGRARIAAGQMTPEELDATLLTAQSRVIANGLADTAVQSYAEGKFTDEAYTSSLKALDEAMASPDLALSRTERSALFGNARAALNAQRSEIKTQERELAAQIRAYQTEAVGELTLAIGDARTRAGEGYGPSPEEILGLRRLASQTRNPSRFNAQIDTLERTTQAQQTMRAMSIPEQERQVAEAERAASMGNAEAARMLDPMRKVASASRRQAEDDPATYAAVRENRDIPVIDWRSEEATTRTMASRFQQAEIAAGDLGVAPKYFSPADRVQLKALADKGGAPALQAVRAIVQSADAAGVDPIRVMEEIGGSGAPLMAQAGTLLAQGAPGDVAAKILSGKAAMGSELVKDKIPKQAVQASAQRTVLGSQLSEMTPEEIDARTRAADAYYATELLENGGQPQGGEKQAYERAMRAVGGEWKDPSGKTFGGQVKIKDKAVTVPPWIEKGQFESVVRGLTATEVLRANASMMFFPSLGKYYGRDATIADYRSAKLIDAGAGRYYVAPDPANERRLIVAPDGRPLVLDLNAIRKDLQARNPTAVR